MIQKNFPFFACNQISIYLFIHSEVFSYDESIDTFESDFSIDWDLVLPLSISSILSLP